MQTMFQNLNSKTIKHTIAAPLLLALLLLVQVSLWNASAQEATQEPLDQPPPVAVTGSTPTQVVAGNTGTLTVTGSNFTANSTVQLDGFGTLATSHISSTELHAALPANLPAREQPYTVQVTDPDAGMAVSPNPLIVAQPTPDPITVTGYAPVVITNGRANVLVVNGSNFTPATRVDVVGVTVTTIYDSPTQLRVSLPDDIAAGEYVVRVSDPQGGSVIANPNLRVAAPVPTAQPPQPTATPLPPTPVPGQPALLVRSSAANPSTIPPQGRTTLTLDIVNQGNRTAQGVSVTVDTSGGFLPAQGQGAVLLADIPPGGSAVATLSVVATSADAAGPLQVPVVIAYRDFEGEGYTTNAAVTVTISERDPEIPQVTLARYMVNPNPVMPGQSATVTVLLQNTGNTTASRVLVRVGSEGILLAGPQGDSFPVGDIPAGGSASVEMPLIVKSDAGAGPRAQGITIEYVQDGEVKQSNASMTLTVAAVSAPAPVLLLEAYNTGVDTLKPGDRFTLTMELRNVGLADAVDLLITFGTVESSGGSGGGSGSGSGSGSSTTPSNVFAPLGTGGTLFVGTVAANGGAASITQEFIVSGSVSSGVYSLPITLRYLRPDGEDVQENLRASLVVVVPPTLQTEELFMPETVFTGEPLPVGITLTNTGTNAVNFVRAEVTAENAEVVEGAELPLAAVRKDENTAINAMVLPLSPGPVVITVTVYYRDDLNREQTLTYTYETTAEEAPPAPPIDAGPPPDVEQPPVEAPQEDSNFLGRLLLGLLGLGS